jgi:hypothetical protein
MNVYLLILFAVLSIIPALVAAVICLLKIESIKGDVLRMSMVTTKIAEDMKMVLSEYGSLTKKISDAEVNNHQTASKFINLEESFQALTNKWNSRERAERTAEKRKEKEEADVDAVCEEIPGTEQLSLPIDFSKPKDKPVPRKRKFGEVPR